MRRLLVLVGVRGSGKTTAIGAFSRGTVLKPSTSRPKRTPTESEYHFETTWDPLVMAWSIAVASQHYGMRRSELDRISDLGITVFEPSNLATLDAWAMSSDFEVITVGLDTV